MKKKFKFFEKLNEKEKKRKLLQFGFAVLLSMRICLGV